MIGERTAEEMKINIGTVYPRVQEVTMDVRGEISYPVAEDYNCFVDRND